MATIGLILPFAVGVALSPMAIVAVIALTRSMHAPVNASAFVAGWALGVLIASMLLLMVAGALGVGATSRPGWVGIVRVAGGLVLLLFAWERAAARQHPVLDGAAPSWVGGLERASADRALAMGAVQAALDPRKLVVIAGAVLSVAQTGQGSTEALVPVIVFALVATLGVALPLVWPAVGGAAGHERMGSLRDRLASDSATIQAVSLLFLGTLLAGQGMAGL